MTAYHYLPSVDVEGAYPPSRWIAPRRADHRTIILAVVGSLAVLPLLHFAVLGAFPSSSYALSQRPQVQGTVPAIAIPRNDTYYRDAYPIGTILKYLELAELEISDRQLGTCDDKLGRGLIEAYHRTRIDFLSPLASGGSEISCTQVQRDSFSDWWPVPAAPCLSTNLRANDRGYKKYHSSITGQGESLRDELNGETFVGSHLEEWDDEECQEEIGRTLLVIPRQDAWNPFHVAEDMVTTLVSALVAVRARPELAEKPIQVVFDDDFGLEGNHFTAMWDRVGAWPPRRLSLDPWDHTCFDTVIHSVTAGMSLLSAQGVGTAHQCGSSITWAASHFYRSLFGLTPNPRGQAINILWLSRAKFDNWAMGQNKWTPWRDARHISNEKEVLARLRSGLAGMGRFVDESATPGHWNEVAREPTVRFASLDPSVHSLETQIHMVGHASVLIGLHGGGLGLSMFLPPGNAVVLELTVAETFGSRHFETMSAQLGLEYDMMLTEKEVDAEALWGKVETWVKRIAAG